MKVKNGIRYEKNGWTYISIQGSPREIGLAHGTLLKAEIKDVFKMLEFDFMDSYGYSCAFFVEVISELYGRQIQTNYPEIYEEMVGIAQGSGRTIEEIITWNCFVSIDSLMGFLPSLIKDNSKLNEKYGDLFSSETRTSSGHGEGGGRGQNDRCTGFMAVGSYTRDGQIVCGHNSFDNFMDGQYMNVMIDIHGTRGARILMQACPGWIHSGTDFYVTSTGFICTETTIGGFNRFALKDPICCRIRHAMQYATTLEECAKILTTNNGGDYANSWLIGDIHKNKIMRIELGLQYVNVEVKTDGYFIGYNAPEDPRIRNLECANTGYSDIRRHQGARRVRLTQFMDEYKGKLDIAIGKEILADHYDVYLNKINPSSRTCCGHYELDDRAFMSDSSRPKPFQPRGAVDGIVCDTALAKKMSLVARWGSSCGTPFDKTEFCKQHIQWREQEPYLKDRPSQPWTEFSVPKAQRPQQFRLRSEVRASATDGRRPLSKKNNKLYKTKSKTLKSKTKLNLNTKLKSKTKIKSNTNNNK